ncbi:DCL family protein [Agromyces sp. SYSU K20354]|uniref:DCL family protein n=1 Tax=Agromyces cavernae TaxID=2898659 RepID=UPI001E462C27|nr:DCL family protein [Agromyces cavernae]MCD2443070.1 DCL family protein [Agromyces cavernae]
MAIAVVLDSFRWSTRSSAEAAFRAILRDSGYELNAPIDSPEHDQMLRELLERHPDHAEKIGGGVEFFYVGLTKDGGRSYVRSDARGIWIRRTDGSTVDFSYRTAIYAHSHKSDVKEAMRGAVEGRRIEYRDRRFATSSPTVSDSSGLPFADEHEARVIYENPTWAQLTYAFAAREGGWDAIAVTSGDGRTAIGTAFRDADVMGRWRDFYDKLAQPLLVAAHEAARRPRSDERAWLPPC